MIKSNSESSAEAGQDKKVNPLDDLRLTALEIFTENLSFIAWIFGCYQVISHETLSKGAI